ncbi:MAG: Uma2 family endonuclease, partial [Thermomicrobiales bacterium]|nr:Uma2 family endonuclease [Thermomicrobiales bacterium]
VNPAPRSKHQSVNHNLVLHLGNYVRAHRLGRVRDNSGVHVSERTYVIPDVVFVARDHLSIFGEDSIEGAPDLVCEILSPSTRRQDLITKRALYARIGVREYWLVDPEALSVTVLVLEGDGFAELAFAEPDVVTSRVLPGLHLRLDDVFDDIDLVPAEPRPQE